MFTPTQGHVVPKENETFLVLPSSLSEARSLCRGLGLKNSHLVVECQYGAEQTIAAQMSDTSGGYPTFIAPVQLWPDNQNLAVHAINVHTAWNPPIPALPANVGVRRRVLVANGQHCKSNLIPVPTAGVELDPRSGVRRHRVLYAVHESDSTVRNGYREVTP